MRPRVLLSDDRGSGPAVVLVPGGLTGWVSWIPHQQRLADRFRVVRVQPIHNELGSAGVPGDLSYTAEVERESLRLTVEELGLAQTGFAGWSRGGGALIEYALAYPQQITSLTLIEPEASWVLGGGDRFGSAEWEEAEAFLQGLEGTEVSEQDLAQFLTLFGMARSPGEAPGHPAWDSWVEHRAALSWPYEKTGDPHRSIDDLEAIQCPVLLVKGTDSTPRDREIVDTLRNHLPNARTVELAGGHASHIESIDRFMEEFESQL